MLPLALIQGHQLRKSAPRHTSWVAAMRSSSAVAPVTLTGQLQTDPTMAAAHTVPHMALDAQGSLRSMQCQLML